MRTDGIRTLRGCGRGASAELSTAGFLPRSTDGMRSLRGTGGGGCGSSLRALTTTGAVAAVPAARADAGEEEDDEEEEEEAASEARLCVEPPAEEEGVRLPLAELVLELRESVPRASLTLFVFVLSKNFNRDLTMEACFCASSSLAGSDMRCPRKRSRRRRKKKAKETQK